MIKPLRHNLTKNSGSEPLDFLYIGIKHDLCIFKSPLSDKTLFYASSNLHYLIKHYVPNIPSSAKKFHAFFATLQNRFFPQKITVKQSNASL